MQSSSSRNYNPTKTVVVGQKRVFDEINDCSDIEDIEKEIPSDCEDTDGNKLQVGVRLGIGASDVACSLNYLTDSKEGRTKKSGKVVIKPRNPNDTHSLYTKKDFNSIYYQKPGQVCLYEIPEENIVRLVVPEAEGELCLDVKKGILVGVDINSVEEMLIFSLSAIRKIKILHAFSRIIIDLKGDNIFYDTKTKESTLIDGGSSLVKGSVENIADRARSHHLAPEYSSGAPANESMDVYSFGVMVIIMIELMQERYPHIETASIQNLVELMTKCTNMDPLKRPTMNELENKLGRDLLEIRGEKLQGKFALSFFAPDRIEFLLENTVTSKNYNL